MKLPCRCAGQPAAWVSFDNGTGVNQCTPQNNTGCHLTSFLQLCSKSHCSHMLTVLGGHLSASLPDLDLSSLTNSSNSLQLGAKQTELAKGPLLALATDAHEVAHEEA